MDSVEPNHSVSSPGELLRFEVPKGNLCGYLRISVQELNRRKLNLPMDECVFGTKLGLALRIFGFFLGFLMKNDRHYFFRRRVLT